MDPDSRTGPDESARGVDVEVSDTQSALRVDAEWLRSMARRVLHAEGVASASISLALVDDAVIHRLNCRHLDHDWPTDVISFTLSGPDEPELVGELVVSAEMALRTAAELGEDPRRELALYVVHGLLHLCGYDDCVEDAAASMARRQEEILVREGLGAQHPGGSAEEGGHVRWSG